MNSLLSRSLKKTAGLLYSLSDKMSPPTALQPVAPSLQYTRVKPWMNDDGDNTHRMNYNLNESSVVIDLGGYEGKWAADIFCKYACTVHIFEPYPAFAKNIEARFKENPKVKIYRYGLTKANVTEKLAISADSSSTYKPGEGAVEIQLVKIDDFLKEHNITHVDLMKINIEGGEYDLLEHLVSGEEILRFENIQVQFHDFVADAVNRMHAIQNNLSKTHELTYQYEFVWENWKLKSQ